MENIQNKIQDKKTGKNSAEFGLWDNINCSNPFVNKDPEELMGEHKW